MTFTSEDHRRRLENIAACECGIRKCLQKHLITGYIPGPGLVQPGRISLPQTWAYLEITESDFFRSALPTRVAASVFANLELYLALANYGASEVRVETADADLPGNEA
jgi:hypothetical protein